MDDLTEVVEITDEVDEQQAIENEVMDYSSPNAQLTVLCSSNALTPKLQPVQNESEGEPTRLRLGRFRECNFV